MEKNFFEKELRKLFENSEVIENHSFTGRVCMARLTDTTNVKLEFVTCGTANHYEAIKATVISRNDGQVDSSVFRFSDIMGTKAIPGNPYLKNVSPHIWYYNGKYEWYAYEPTPWDSELMTETIDSYLAMFQEPVQSMTQQMI